jgi:hypothetical protein
MKHRPALEVIKRQLPIVSLANWFLAFLHIQFLLSSSVNCFSFALTPMSRSFVPTQTSSSRVIRAMTSVSSSLDDDDSNSVAHAHRIMWKQHSRKRQAMQYRIIAAEVCEPMAKAMQEVCAVRNILVYL